MYTSTVIRLGLAGCLVGLLGGAPPLLGAVKATHAAVRPPIIQPLLLGSAQARAHDDDGHDGQDGCSALIWQCFSPTACQPIVIVKRILVPVQVIKKVFVPVQVIKIVKVFVPVPVVPTATQIPVTPPTTKVEVKVSVPGQAPPPTATPDTSLPGIGDPSMF